MPLVELGRRMNIVEGADEFVKPRNVGILFFNESPETFLPGHADRRGDLSQGAGRRGTDREDPPRADPRAGPRRPALHPEQRHPREGHQAPRSGRGDAVSSTTPSRRSKKHWSTPSIIVATTSASRSRSASIPTASRSSAIPAPTRRFASRPSRATRSSPAATATGGSASSSRNST